MRRFLSKAAPRFERVLLVESGSRELFEQLLPTLYGSHPDMRADLVTCYAGLPQAFLPDRGRSYSIHDYRDAEGRKRLCAELAANAYNVIAILCSAEPIMTKWKWMLAARVPAKLLIVNENGDYFWFDRGHLGIACHFVLFRAGLSGGDAVKTLGRVAVFPFALAYLVLFAAAVHARRILRTL